MRKPQPSQRPWHPIEAAIVRQVSRYGVMTPTALHAAATTGVQDLHQASDRLRALARRGDLVRHRRLIDEDGFTLTPHAIAQAKVIGVTHPAQIRSLPALLRAFARLSVCLLHETRRTLLRPLELAEHFPELNGSGQQPSYYLTNHTDHKRLGFLRIDGCGHGRWDRIARKASDDMRKHMGIPSIQQLIEQQQFEVTVVTALPSKAQRIEEVLRSQQDMLSVPFRVLAIPELTEFLRPRPG